MWPGQFRKRGITMFERLRICLLHPRYIGKFIIEKMWKIWILYAIMIIIMYFIIFGLIYVSTSLTSTDVNFVTNNLYQEEGMELKYQNKILSGNGDQFIYTSDGISLGFYFLEEPDFEKSDFSIVFRENCYEAYIENILIWQTPYANLNISDFTITATGNEPLAEISLGMLISNAFLLYRPSIAASNALITVLENLGTLLVVLILAGLFTMNLNSSIRGKYRFSLIVHCGLSYLVVYNLSYMLNFSILQYLGMMLPIIYLFMALRSIVKIEGTR